MSLVKLQINHDKTENKNITPKDQSQDMMEKMRVIPYHPPENWIPHRQKFTPH